MSQKIKTIEKVKLCNYVKMKINNEIIVNFK